ETIRTTRASLNLLGDGLVEAVADETLIEIARAQRRATRGTIRGQALYVPILEAPGETRIGRFGWKDQHASLLSFSADAYLNEMGFTTRLFPDEVTTLCNTASEPNDTTHADGLADFERFARFVRATKAPARDTVLAATPAARRGSELFDAIGCATCHVRTLVTAAAGTAINGGTDTIPSALGEKAFHPFGDYLLHNIGTGDGIVMAMPEHYGPAVYKVTWREFSIDSVGRTRYKVRTALRPPGATRQITSSSPPLQRRDVPRAGCAAGAAALFLTRESPQPKSAMARLFWLAVMAAFGAALVAGASWAGAFMTVGTLP